MTTLVGKVNSLEILKEVSFGVFLDGDDLGEILMPKRYVPDGSAVGDRVEAFIYHDSEDRLIATTEKPKLIVGECAFLKVQSLAPFGAFVDWGLPKDLLVPTNQQAVKMEAAYSYVVYAYVDRRTGRIAGSTKLSLYLEEDGKGFRVGDRVDLQIAARSDLGFKAVINNTHLGLIFHEEVKEPLKFGARMPGYIKQVRKEDGRIDLALDAGRATTRKDLNQKILDYIAANDGVSEVTDRSSPELISDLFGVSKGNYKKALGALYREKKIVIEPERIILAKPIPAKAKRSAGAGRPSKAKVDKSADKRTGPLSGERAENKPDSTASTAKKTSKKKPTQPAVSKLESNKLAPEKPSKAAPDRPEDIWAAGRKRREAASVKDGAEGEERASRTSKKSTGRISRKKKP